MENLPEISSQDVLKTTGSQEIVHLDAVLQKRCDLHQKITEGSNSISLTAVLESPWTPALLSISLMMLEYALQNTDLDDSVCEAMQQIKGRLEELQSELSSMKTTVVQTSEEKSYLLVETEKISQLEDIWVLASLAIIFHGIMSTIISQSYLIPLLDLRKGVRQRANVIEDNLRIPHLQNADILAVVQSQVAQLVTCVLNNINSLPDKYKLDSVLEAIGCAEFHQEVAEDDKFLDHTKETLFKMVFLLAQKGNGDDMFQEELPEKFLIELGEVIEQIVENNVDAWIPLKTEQDTRVLTAMVLRVAMSILRILENKYDFLRQAFATFKQHTEALV